MSDEEGFQAALDARPEDWGLRLIFADYLEERNDPRALGLRALGQLRMWPCHLRPVPADPACDHWMFQMLPALLRAGDPMLRYTFDSLDDDMKTWFRMFCSHLLGSHHRSRRDAEDDAAHGFARLDARTQRAILTRRPAAASD